MITALQLAVTFIKRCYFYSTDYAKTIKM